MVGCYIHKVGGGTLSIEDIGAPSQVKSSFRFSEKESAELSLELSLSSSLCACEESREEVLVISSEVSNSPGRPKSGSGGRRLRG